VRTLESAADRESIIQRISALGPSDRGLWGTMSPHQMVCHLYDSYRAALGEKYVSSASGFLRGKVFKLLALRFPMKWPRGVPTRPEVQQGAGGTVPTEFEHDRAVLLATLARFREGSLLIAHPTFGPMTVEEWMRWGYLHADHHLRQFGR
jgi:DinB superfamily